MSESVAMKGAMGVVAGVFGYLCNSFNALLVVLALLMMVDYITGVTVALRNGKFDKQIGAWGAVKKLFYVMIVLVGFLADFTISYLSGQIGLDFSTGGLLGVAATLYLIGNEGLSTTKNWVALGLPSPPFLMKAFGFMKDQSGRIIQIPQEEEDKKGKVNV